MGKWFSNGTETSCLPLWNAGFQAGKSQTPIRQQTECPLTSRLSYRRSNKNLNSKARPHDKWAFSTHDFTANFLSHLALAIYIFVVNSVALAQASDFRIEGRQVVFLCWMSDSKLGSLRHLIASRPNVHSQTKWASKNQTKTWTQHPVHMISVHIISLDEALYIKSYHYPHPIASVIY